MLNKGNDYVLCKIQTKYLYFLKDLFQRVHMHVCMSSGRGEGKRECQEDSLLSMEPKACGARSHHPQQHHDWSGNQESDTQPTVPLRYPKVFVLLRKINPKPVSQKNQTNKNMGKTVFAMVTKNAYLAALNYHFTHTKTKSLIKFQ